MLDNRYLDTIISLVLVYALLSILVSILLESWNKRIKLRGVFLQKVIYRLLDDPLNHNYGYLIYQHPIIDTMRRDGNSYPHYIPAEGFANALIDTIADQAVSVRYEMTGTGDYVKVQRGLELHLASRFEKGVALMADSGMKRLLLNFMDRNRGNDGMIDMDRLKDELGRWFDGNMERASGEYKNDQRNKLRFLGFLVAFSLNVDALHMTKVFLLDKDLRDRLVAEADAVVDRYEQQRKELGKDTLATVALLRSLGLHTDAPITANLLRAAEERIDTLTERYAREAEQVVTMVRAWQLPMGWNPADAPLSWLDGVHLREVPASFRPSHKAVLEHFKRRNEGSWGNLFRWLLGISISGWSLSLGAPFWFEALVKLINIRRSGTKPMTTDERHRD